MGNKSSSNFIKAIQEGDLEKVKKSIEKGVNVNQADQSGKSPIRIASSTGHIEIVKYLVEHGANINIKDKDGFTPLLIAAGDGKL